MDLNRNGKVGRGVLIRWAGLHGDLSPYRVSFRLHFNQRHVSSASKLCDAKSDLRQHFPFIFTPNANGLCNNALPQLGNGSDQIEPHARLSYSDE